jgi:hypothetical protein
MNVRIPGEGTYMYDSLNHLTARPILGALGALLLVLSPLALPPAAMAEQPQVALHPSAAKTEPAPLAAIVRKATERFRDINVAMAEGWVPATPCVSGPDTGAMGVHFVHPQPDRVGDGVLEADSPEFLIYEPLPGGAMRLVGVEFVVLASDWEHRHPKGGTPSLEGNLLNFVGAPNRYGLPAFYELHVWAWENNPKGSFADWNTRVSCDRQPGN